MTEEDRIYRAKAWKWLIGCITVMWGLAVAVAWNALH